MSTKIRRSKWIHRVLSLIIAGTLFGSCGSGGKHYDDTPTGGNVLIVADECQQPLLDVELDTFMKLYKYATVRTDYLPESNVFDRLLHDDSVRIGIVCRELTETEKAYFTAQKIVPRTTKVAVDAVALLLHPQNPDTQLTYSQVSSLVRGESVRWPSNRLRDSVKIVFDRNGSSNARLLHERFVKDGATPKHWYALNSNKAVIDYVASTPGAMGVVGVNWISDRHDPEVESFLNKVKIAEISLPEDSAGSDFYGPYQAYIALKKYPLTRDVYVISREGRNGLGTGFASFLAGDQGQRLVRMCGLLPATMPVRIINIR